MIHVAFNGFPRETLSQNLRDERVGAGLVDVTGVWTLAPALLASSEVSSSEQSGCCSLAWSTSEATKYEI